MKAARLLLRPEGGAFPGVDTALAAAGDVTREQLLHLEWLADGTYAMLYRLGGESARVRALLADHPKVIDLDVVDGPPDGAGPTTYVYVHAEEEPALSDLLAVAEDHALLLEPPFELTADGIVVTIVGEAGAIQGAFAAASERIPIEVMWSGGYEPGTKTPLARLTDRQREALRVAVDLGFYERPRETDFAELGGALDCAPSTANELLRRAEATLVTGVIER